MRFFGIFNKFPETSRLKISSGLKLVTSMMYGQVSFYILLSILVFILPRFSQTYVDDVYKITATILFIMGPLSQFAGMIPIVARANIAVGTLYKLEERLDKAVGGNAETGHVPLIKDFQRIKAEELSFFYRDKFGRPLFAINGINLTLLQGELLFIVGGNGSGKSTFLKLFTGLYQPEEGHLYVDEKRIDSKNSYQSYRELFAIIFTDFHLFDRLYGLGEVDEEQVNALLRLVELDKKVQYIDGRFTNLDLSTGQKKRLAFVAAVLEDKAIYIFDELAADQDPQFRKRFYEKILPDLQQQGKTIIAVTHDDHYFHVADRILKMEYGQLVKYNEHAV
ncbi:MAG: ATP-binding cassette domain-containing protein [Candidatus Electrothrix sp. EH2]|nr:ATP-binding cassette domain-containing protein [Candidatus Electrothrix sp. EH2]